MDLARAYTSNPVHIRLERPAEQRRADIDHRFMSVTSATKIRLLAETIGRANGLSLVFVRTKHGADRLARRLARDYDLRAAVMHGDMSQSARERSLAQFEAGKVSTLVATDVAARGLDVDAITHVINFDPPRTDDDYVHRVGRAGRAGRSGTGVTLVLPEQWTDVGRLAARLGHADTFAASVGRLPAAPRRPRCAKRGRRPQHSPSSRWATLLVHAPSAALRSSVAGSDLISPPGSGLRGTNGKARNRGPAKLELIQPGLVFALLS